MAKKKKVSKKTEAAIKESRASSEARDSKQPTTDDRLSGLNKGELTMRLGAVSQKIAKVQEQAKQLGSANNTLQGEFNAVMAALDSLRAKGQA